MHYHMPKIPTLAPKTFTQWLLAITCGEEALGNTEVLADNNYTLDTSQHRSVFALASGILTYRLAKYAATVIPDETTINPDRIVERARNKLKTIPEVKQRALKLNSESKTLEQCATPTEFFQAYESICVQMINRMYLDIGDGKVTIKFIIRALKRNPKFYAAIINLISLSPTTIKELYFMCTAAKVTIQSKVSRTQTPAVTNPVNKAKMQMHMNHYTQQLRYHGHCRCIYNHFCHFYASLG